jgi:hypothetical protein
MKLNKLYNYGPKRNKIFLEYISKLKKLSLQENTLEKLANQVLNEGKRVVVTTEIIDDDEPKQTVRNVEEPRPATCSGGGVGLDSDAKQQFIEQARSIGKFDNPEWIRQVINGLKQAGAQGVSNLSSISESERPVTAKEVRQLIEALVQLVSK